MCARLPRLPAPPAGLAVLASCAEGEFTSDDADFPDKLREGLAGLKADGAPDGKHLYYSSQGKLMSVEITSRPALSATAPTPAWDLAALGVPPNRLGNALYDLLPDGRLLAVQKAPEEQNPTQANVILNFDEVLKERLRAARR